MENNTKYLLEDEIGQNLDQETIALLSEVLCQNFTLGQEQSTPSAEPQKKGTHPNALLYIIVVLGLYACSMVILMVKYVRREKEEAKYHHYFTEFVKRDSFDSARYQNKSYVRSLMENTLRIKKREDINPQAPSTVSAKVPYQKVTAV